MKLTGGVGLGKGVAVTVRVGAGDDWDTAGVDVAGEARVAPSVGVIETVPGGKVRVTRRRVAVDVAVALGVAVDEGGRVGLGVGVKDGIAVALGEGTGVALGEGSGEAVAVSTRVGNDTVINVGVTSRTGRPQAEANRPTMRMGKANSRRISFKAQIDLETRLLSSSSIGAQRPQGYNGEHALANRQCALQQM